MVEQQNIAELTEVEKESLILALQKKLQESEKERVQLKQQLAIHQRWSKLQRKLFPNDCRGRVIGNIDIGLLAADFVDALLLLPEVRG